MNAQATAQTFTTPNTHPTSYAPATIIAQPSLEELATIYKNQERECWLCDKISSKIMNNIEISEDDQWHFTSCVLSWEHVHKH